MRLLGKRRLATGVFLTLERVHFLGPAGVDVLRDVVRHPGGVGVLVIDGDDVVLVRQHRAPFESSFLEIPAGKLEPGERSKPEEAAVRECEEEIGARPGGLIKLAEVAVSPGYTDEVIHVYLAEELTWLDRRPDGAEELQLEVERLPIPEALHRIESGEITDSKTQVALLTWARRTDPK